MRCRASRARGAPRRPAGARRARAPRRRSRPDARPGRRRGRGRARRGAGRRRRVAERGARAVEGRAVGDPPRSAPLGAGRRRPLGRRHVARPAIETYASIQTALSALDRLEVRGRDSAGLSVLVEGHDLDLADPTVARIVGERRDPLFAGGAVHASGGSGQLAFVYKVAAEIGELGDNTAALRAAIRADELLRLALRSPDPRHRARPHALGERRHHLRAERASARQRGDRRPSSSRSSSPRSTATSTTTPTCARSRRCASRPRSPPTPR